MFKFMKNDNFLNIFMSFGLFPKVFGQVNEWLVRSAQNNECHM